MTSDRVLVDHILQVLEAHRSAVRHALVGEAPESPLGSTDAAEVDEGLAQPNAGGTGREGLALDDGRVRGNRGWCGQGDGQRR